MEIILLEQFYINIIKNNKIYLYYKIIKEFLIIFISYLKYINIFNKIIKMIFLLYWNNLNYKIKLIFKIMPFFSPLYNLFKKELEILRDYIDKNLKSNYITWLKSFTAAFILFIKKKNSFL